MCVRGTETFRKSVCNVRAKVAMFVRHVKDMPMFGNLALAVKEMV